MINTFNTTRSLLAEARTWLGNGTSAGKTTRDAWPSGLANLIDRRLSSGYVRMSPCSQGHTDIGAAGGIAHCYVCGEQEIGASTAEANANWGVLTKRAFVNATARLEAASGPIEP